MSQHLLGHRFGNQALPAPTSKCRITGVLPKVSRMCWILAVPGVYTEVMQIKGISGGLFVLLAGLFLQAGARASEDRGSCPGHLLPQSLQESIRSNVYSRRDIGATNDRSWQTYVETLAIRWIDWNGKRLIIDLGAGQGIAMKEAVETGAFERAVLIDFHDFGFADHWFFAETDTLHRVIHEQGAAELVLAKYDSAADVIVDNYGAFTYSPARLHLLKSAFRALRPGGRAYLRTPPVSFVKMGDESMVPLEVYLEKKFPRIFSVRNNERFPKERPTNDQMIGASRVLVMYRPKDAPFPEFSLKLLSESHWLHPHDSHIRFPLLMYGEAGAR
jgi:SAM-dependent methyltransferase